MSDATRSIQTVEPTPETQPYWDAANEGKLLIKSCTDCGKNHYYPRTYCPYCQSDNTKWLEASGAGSIYTYSVYRRTPAPYAIAYVTLSEGVTMLSNIVDTNLDALGVGQDVKVVFKASESGQKVPMFTPV
jgi:uncharacterized OB-fold protein